MWIIRLALKRPYTFVVAALLLLLMTQFVLTRTPTDIFPAIKIPVVSVIWSFTGLPADQIAQRMVYTQERALTTTVNNIEHIESTSYDSIGVIKVYFQPGTDISTAVAQLTAVSQTILKQLDAKGIVQLRDVSVGRDFGVRSEILRGVTESDEVIVNPSGLAR